MRGLTKRLSQLDDDGHDDKTMPKREEKVAHVCQHERGVSPSLLPSFLPPSCGGCTGHQQQQQQNTNCNVLVDDGALPCPFLLGCSLFYFFKNKNSFRTLFSPSGGDTTYIL